VSKDRVPVEERPSVLFQALRLDPFSKDIWFEWLDRFGDRDGSLAVAAEAIGIVELPERKGALVSQRLAALPQSTPEECQSAVAKLNDYAAFLGVDGELERQLLLAKADELDVQRRSFRGKVYTTQDKAAAAETEWRRGELDKLAADLSTDRTKIQREGDRLVIVQHPGEGSPPQWVRDALLRREMARLRTPNEKRMIIGLSVVGLCLLPFGGFGLIPLLLSGLYWWHGDNRRGKALRAAHPAVFGSPQDTVPRN
jgi:hypothetical protein